MVSLLHTAIGLASALHRGQKRMSGEAFIAHPLNVLQILQGAEVTDADILLTAVLHDTLEDLPLLEDVRHATQSIERVCGEDVAMMVRSLTKDRTNELVPHRTREERYIERMTRHARRHPGILLVKLADRLHNIRTATALPRARRERIITETRELYLPFFAQNLLQIPYVHHVAYLTLLKELRFELARFPTAHV